MRHSVVMPALAVLAAALVAQAALGANKNGVAPNAVVLPAGPGSILGLGEDFAPDLPTGSAKYVLPIALPRGVTGFTPDDLGLKYDSGLGNGILGFGWELDLPRVERRLTKPLPRYVDGPNGLDDDGDGETDEADEIDRFLSEVHEAPVGLVPLEDGYYLGQNEGAFIRYARVDDYWEGTFPNGNRMVFGRHESARVMDPATGRVRRWSIEEETDTNGNTIRYTYTAFPGEDNLNQVYLALVEYGPAAPPWENFHFVAFDYEPRGDVIEDGRGGFLVRTGMRIKTITVGTQGPRLAGHAQGDYNGDGVTDNLDRRYVLTYGQDPHWSLLTTVTLVGADGVTAMPPMRLGYTRCDTSERIDVGAYAYSSENTPRKLMDNPAVELTDLNGDALPDILETDPLGGPHHAYLNRGAVDGVIRWADGMEMGGDDRAARVDLAGDVGVIADLADLSGDGRSDLVYRAGPRETYYFPSVVEGGAVSWGERITMNVDAGFSAPPSPYENAGVKRSDMNGDKRGDVVQSFGEAGLTGIRIWYNLGGRRFSKPFSVGQDFGFRLDYSGVSLTDFNGDGVPDMTRITPTGVEAAAGLGYGRFAALRKARLPDHTLNRQQLGKASLRDLNGDGLPDLVVDRAAPGELWYWMNRGNYAFDPRRVMGGLPAPLGVEPATRWADLNGNGTTDLVIADPLAEHRLLVFDLGEALGCVPAPNLLNRIENGIGRVIEIRYETTTRFLLADTAAGRPWPDPMPFTVDVVGGSVTDDSLGHSYRRDYAYHDGFYHTGFRFFTGFGRVDVTHHGDASAPTLVMRYTFDVGREVFALRGAMLTQTAEREDGKVFWRETDTQDSRVLYTGVDGKKVTFPFTVRKVREIIEGGAGTPRRVVSESDFDDYGNLVASREYGVVEDGNRGAFHDEKITEITYAYNIDDWMVRFPIRSELKSLGGEVIARTEFYYDDETHGADNFGVVVNGRKTLVRKWTNPGDPGAFVDEGRVKYNAVGNPVVLMDPLAEVNSGVINDAAGHYRSLVYDPRFHTSVIRETVHVGGDSADLVYRADYDYGLAVVTSVTDFNGAVTTYGHDPFGRLEHTVRPGDTPAFPTLEYSYHPALDIPGVGIVNMIETRQLDRTPGAAGSGKRAYYTIKRSYADGLGRLLMERAEAEPDPATGAPRVVVTNAALYNARGGKWAVLRPHFAMGGGGLDDLLAYESIEAPPWQGLFHEDGVLAAMGLDDALKTTTAYDALLRPMRTVFPDDTEEVRQFEPLLTRVFDANDLDPVSSFFDTPVIRYTDGLGRLYRVDEVVHLGDDGNPVPERNTWTTRYAYRADGLLTAITDAQGNVRTFRYDGLGRKRSLDDPNRGARFYFHDAASNLLRTVDAMGREITYTYDGANRVLTEDFHDEGEAFSFGYVYDPAQPLTPENRPDVAYFYDTPAGSVDMGDGTSATAENTKGRLAVVWDLHGEYHRSYDARGRLAWSVDRRPDMETGVPVSYRTAMTYDSLDRVREIVYPDGDRCTYAFNERSLLREIGGGAGANRDGAPYILRTAEYTPSGRRLRFAHGNGVSGRYTYDARGRLNALQAYRADNENEPILAYDYTFDAVGNLRRIHDVRPRSVLPADDPRRNTQIFGLDDRYRLTAVRFSFAPPEAPDRDDGLITYRYDRVGNMVSKTSDLDAVARGFSVTNLGDMRYGGAPGAWNRVGDDTADPGPHALTGAGAGEKARVFAYDGNGNMTAIDDLVCTWDYKDRLVRVEDGAMRAEYGYNHAGERVSKRVYPKDGAGRVSSTPAVATEYVGRHFEIRRHGQPVKYVYDGNERVARITGTLDASAQRVQRFHLVEGWNLLSMAVDAPDAARQLGIDSNPLITGGFLAAEPEASLVPLAADTPMPAGTVFWIRADAATVIDVRGTYTEGAAATGTVERGYWTTALLETLDLETALPEGIPFVWVHDANRQTWRAGLAGGMAFLSDLPEALRPGEPLFIETGAPVEIRLPEASARIHYYLHDHLGSSSLMVDAEGRVVEETAYYPFGEPRYHFRALDRPREPYQYTGKERDAESNLQFFGARYLAASLGRFTSVDPVVEAVPAAALADPQLLHAYGFARNNPLIYKDPDGRFITTAIARSKLRALNPFSPENRGSPLLTRSERIAEVFAGLKIKKGGRLPEGSSIGGQGFPGFLNGEASLQRTSATSNPEDVIKPVIAQAEKLKAQYQAKGLKIDVDQFLNALRVTQESATPGQKLAAAMDDPLGPLFADLEDVTIFNEKTKAGVGGILGRLDRLDLEAKYDQFKGLAEKSFAEKKFNFDVKEVNRFIEQFVDLPGQVGGLGEEESVFGNLFDEETDGPETRDE